METTANTDKTASSVKLDELARKIDRLTVTVESQSVIISQLYNLLLQVVNMVEHQNLPPGQSQTPRPGISSYPAQLRPVVYPPQPQYPSYPQQPFQQPMQPVKNPAVSHNPYMSHSRGDTPNPTSLPRVDIDEIIKSLMEDTTESRLYEFYMFTGENEDEICIQKSVFPALGSGHDYKTAAMKIKDFMRFRPKIYGQNVLLYVVNPVYDAPSGQIPGTRTVVSSYKDLIKALTVKP